MPDQWTPGRLNDRFRSIDEHLQDLRDEIRVFAPTAATVGKLDVKVDELREDVAELKADVKEIVNRSVTLRIAVVLAPILLTCMGLGLALLTGRIG